MYDSRSNHARPPRQRDTFDPWVEQYEAYERGRAHGSLIRWREGRRMTDAAAIAEGLADMHDEPEYMVGDGLTRAGHEDWLGSRPCSWSEEDQDWRVDPWADPIEENLDTAWVDEEPLADWELTLLNGDDIEDDFTPLWDSSAPDANWGEQDEEDFWPEQDETPWFAMPLDQFFEDMHGFWHVEGPSMTRPEPTREGHYVRVWQLAEDLCVESKHVIEVLRLAGEYVKSHQSYVAKPVADAVMLGREWIVAKYGEREDPKVDVTTTLRYLLLQEDQRAKAGRPGPNPFTTIPRPGNRPAVGAFAPARPRPGMPRPGNNPFITTNAY